VVLPLSVRDEIRADNQEQFVFIAGLLKEMTTMTALHEEWQAARRARQDEMVQRRAAMQATLDQHLHVRMETTAELQQMLAEHHASIQDETYLYLSQVHQQRQIQAQETADVLQAFDAELQATVATMRSDNRQQMQEIAACVDDLRLATQALLAGHQRDRAVQRRLQQQELTEYVANLEDTVADHLDDLTENRQAKAIVDQAQRHRDREALTHDVQTMQEDFAIYRQQLQAFRERLRQSVWGSAVLTSSPAVTAKTVKPMTPQPTVAAKSTKRNQTTPPPRPKTSTTRRRRAKAQSRPGQSEHPQSSAPVPNVTPKLEVPNEEAVFDYLQTHSDGARLTEIESTLGINRFQAVDALRSLIQKELIVQKDRTYQIQEDAVL
jgi:hypothetical protein